MKDLEPGRPCPMYGESWKLNKSGICGKCVKDRKNSKRVTRQVHKKKQANNIPVDDVSMRTAAKFSGIYSPEEDLAYDPKSTYSVIRHNDMHFRPIPPFLKELSTTELALVSKMTVVMNVHVQRTGMFASKGHSVSLPQPMNEAKQLPRLPAEVNIIVFKRSWRQKNKALLCPTIKCARSSRRALLCISSLRI